MGFMSVFISVFLPMYKPLESAFHVSRFYKWQCGSGRKHWMLNKKEGIKTRKKDYEESVFIGAG